MQNVSLVENAYDSIIHRVDHLEVAIEKDSVFDYKRTVLDFCHVLNKRSSL